MKIIDLTRTFTARMPVFPGDSPTRLTRDIDAGDGITHFHIETGLHAGTHMDAPLHMIPGGKKLSEFSVEKFVAQGHLIDARGKEEINVSLLDNKNIQQGDCVLIYTGFDEKFGTPEFYTDYPVLAEDFARELVDIGISFIGMDTPSPDNAPYAVHRILLGSDILIIEGLCNLNELATISSFEVIALPAKFEAEAAPIRVVARVE